MNTKLMSIFTRTPLHVGAGSSVGAIDLPIIRECHTRFPVIPGSAIKGVFADEYLTPDKKRNADGLVIFGSEDSNNANAGKVSFGEARLLAFPLRSAKGSFALVTCPLALSRFKRDSGLNFEIPAVADSKCFAGNDVVLKNSKVALEEYVFEYKGDFPTDWAEKLSGLLDDAVLSESKTRLVLLSDGDFSHFAANACQVQHHNKIDDKTGTVDGSALFNLETVPSETLFYAPLTVLHESDAVTGMLNRFSNETLLQFGGKSTTGLGFCTVKFN
jgi:CRISPR-associated protein Cmr4